MLLIVNKAFTGDGAAAMRTVRVDRDEFLVKVKANRQLHRKVFDGALAGYSIRLTRELERRIHDLRRGRHIDQYIGLPEPEDHTDDYDRVITMAEMSVSDVLDLTEDEFGMYIMDQWRWKQSFSETADRYLR